MNRDLGSFEELGEALFDRCVTIGCFGASVPNAEEERFSFVLPADGFLSPCIGSGD